MNSQFIDGTETNWNTNSKSFSLCYKMIEIECQVSTFQKTFLAYIKTLIANQWATFDLQLVIVISISKPFVS